MKASFAFFSLLLSIILFICNLSAEPSVELSEKVFDFGYTPQNSRMSHVFWVRSTGDDSLRIVSVSTGCGCTRAPLDKEVIAPGDSAELEIIFSSRRFRDKVSKIPVLFLNTPHEAESLKIEAYVLDDPSSTESIRLEPFGIDYENFDLYAEEIRFEITNTSGRDLNIKLISRPHEFVEIELPEEIKAGETVAGFVRLTENGREKSFAKSFTFEINDDSGSRFTMPIWRQLPQHIQKTTMPKDKVRNNWFKK